MSVFSERLKQLRGNESQASFAAEIGVNRVQYAKYESSKNAPSIEVLATICRVHACSADWLLGLPERGRAVIASGSGSQAAGRDIHNAGGDCSRCKLMQAHLREITGRG